MPIYGSLRNYLGPVLPSSDGHTLVLNTTGGGNMLSMLVFHLLISLFVRRVVPGSRPRGLLALALGVVLS